MTILTDKLEVGQTNAALLVEELTEIYTTNVNGDPDLPSGSR